VKLTIVMPCYSAEATLAAQLDAFVREPNAGEWELLIADNGSMDNSRTIAERYRARMPQLRVIDASARRSCASAKNIGAESALGEALIFCDADDVIAPGYVRAMARALDQHDMVACRYEFKKLNPPWLVKARGGNQENGLPTLKYPPYSNHAWGGSLGIRTHIHRLLNGYDESMRYLADTDYCVRAQQMGFKIQFVRDAVVHYRHRSTLRSIYRQARTWSEYDQAIFARYGGKATKEKWRWRAHANIWITVLKRTPELLRSQEGRGILMWRLGCQIGYLLGSVKHRVAPIVEL
jgi:glycosyltransferase involved in cell wall biosynthesis